MSAPTITSIVICPLARAPPDTSSRAERPAAYGGNRRSVLKLERADHCSGGWLVGGRHGVQNDQIDTPVAGAVGLGAVWGPGTELAIPHHGKTACGQASLTEEFNDPARACGRKIPVRDEPN